MPHPSRYASNDPHSPAHAARLDTPIAAYEGGQWTQVDDALAVERALEIHVAGAAPLITMRTPGADRALAAGLLHSEGVIRSSQDIVYLRHTPGEPDVIRMMLKPEARSRLDRIERSTVATSACGVCGKPSFSPPSPSGRVGDDIAALAVDLLLGLPDTLRAQQGVFASTGGIHAAGLFDRTGRLMDLAEDVGRHNALDKLIGRALLAERLPLSDHILLLSGRASYELLQKSVMAGLAVVCAISAPSSYAVALARQFDVTLVGFLRGHRFNVYSGARRIAGAG